MGGNIIKDGTYTISDDVVKVPKKTMDVTIKETIDAVIYDKLISWLMKVNIIKSYAYNATNSGEDCSNTINIVFDINRQKDSDELRELIKESLLHNYKVCEIVTSCKVMDIKKNTEHKCLIKIEI